MRTRRLAVLLLLVPGFALAQGTPDIPPPGQEPKVIVVPVPVEAFDAGIASQPAPLEVPVAQPAAPEPAPQPAPEPQLQPVPEPQPAPVEPPPAQPVPDALVPESPPPEPQPAGAMLDGHPREGAFLAGPGSGGFIAHHTLLGFFGGLSTQMVPRIGDIYFGGDPYPFDEGDRIAYLTSGLLGAGVGFGASAIYQFFRWIDGPAAGFGALHSLYGAMFFSGFTHLVTGGVPQGAPDQFARVSAITWLGFLGAEAAAWTSILLGGGELPVNKGVLASTGAYWAAVFTGLILGIVASSGGGTDVGSGIDAILLAPGLGAVALGLFGLKYNPSTARIMRANLMGTLVGAAVYVVSALVMGLKFANPVPFALGAVGAAGALGLTAWLWVDAADPSSVAPADGKARALYGDLWWW